MNDRKDYQKVTVFSQRTALAAAKILSIPFKLLGKGSPFTEKMVFYCCITAYLYNEKAKKMFGYKVEVSIKEGVERTCKVC
jgi:hypothetical protein